MKDFKVQLVFIGLMLLLFFFLGNIGKWQQKRFFREPFSGIIQDIYTEPKGYYVIQVEEQYYNLGDWGYCIDEISIGDSIQKLPNSDTLIISRKNENYKRYVYDCMGKE